MFTATVDRVFAFFFSERSRKLFERVAFTTAIVVFMLHFLAIILANLDILPDSLIGSKGYQNSIVSIYTPFSIILIYEIYLLIYYLPKSITIYLGKQYEIVALILIRKIFSDLANLTFIDGKYDVDSIRTLVVSLVGLIIILLLILCFYRLSNGKVEPADEKTSLSPERKRFVTIKKIMALCLIGAFIVLFISSLIDMHRIPFTIKGIVDRLKSVNATFYYTFFTALILIEVLLLLFTYNLSNKFYKIIRNAGFIASTILLKLSFRVDGFQSIVLILIAITFGVSITGIYRLYSMKGKKLRI